MTFTCTGFQATVDQEAWAKALPNIAGPPKVLGTTDFALTLNNTASARGFTVAKGVAVAYGIKAAETASTQLQCATLGSGTRWDTVVLRIDWSAKTATLVVLSGTSAKALSSLVKSTRVDIGVSQQDYPLALVQTGPSTILAWESLRTRSSTMLTTDSSSLLGVPTDWPDLTVMYGDTLYRRSGSDWLPLLKPGFVYDTSLGKWLPQVMGARWTSTGSVSPSSGDLTIPLKNRFFNFAPSADRYAFVFTNANWALQPGLQVFGHLPVTGDATTVRVRVSGLVAAQVQLDWIAVHTAGTTSSS